MPVSAGSGPLEACCESWSTSARRGCRLAVAANAAFYWLCNHNAMVQAGQCRQWSEAYERDYAAFMEKYRER